VYSVDFERYPNTVKQQINSWAKLQTAGKIAEMISDDIDRSTRMILANTLYFKAKWEIDFIGGETKKRDFYPNGVGTQPVLSVESMAGTGAYPYYEDRELNCHIIGIPYHGNMSTMYVIQPLDSSVEQLERLQENLNADIIDQMISKMKRVSAIVVFPKMHITQSLNLREYLRSMGIGGIFTPIQYDLSMIVTKDDRFTRYNSDAIETLRNLDAQRAAQPKPPTPRAELIISEIVHKVDFNVDETGTEAAAATAAFLKKSGPEINFIVNTPFILLVRNDLTHLPLFYGVINEPPSQKFKFTYI